jgi:hypothetical protein
MFGLMRAKKCGMSADEKNFRRLHYCGTCKTIGSLYGQKSRLLLNHDTVFLAEILTNLSDETTETWQKSYQSYNCLSLPKDEMPFPLKFAATTNIILTEFKIADHISDTRQRRFKLAHRIFSKEFLIAEKLLNEWNFPLEKVRNLLQTQTEIENSANNLDEYSLPTATATAYFFSHGVKLIGKENLENLAHEIGFAFGKLIYILDAFEDFEKDEKANQFNALRSAFGEKKKAVSILLEVESEIIAKIYELPISEVKKQIFASRLRENLQKKIQSELPHVCFPKKRLTFNERYERAKIRAKELTVNYSFATALPIFVFVLMCAMVAPAQVREAKSARECAEMSFNLMFLGSIFGVVLALPRIFLQEGYTPPEAPANQTKKFFKRKGKGGGTNGNNGGDGCCFCCCDCDNFGDCCDGCECCTGCCDCCGDCSCDC